MSDFRPYTIDETEIDTILGEDIDFKGTLKFEESLMIKGQFRGSIEARGEVYIDERADVEARILAKVVSLKGKVKGDIFAGQRVELFKSASVDGDITAPDIIMESGCRFNGVCSMKLPPEFLEEGEKKQ